MEAAPTESAPAVTEHSMENSAEDARNRVAQARSLLLSGNRPSAGEAYVLLAPLEFGKSGDPDFNYLLGLAALEAGKPNDAVFALLRAVAAEPGFAGARIELARAYFEAGDNEDARREFNVAAGQQPPPAAAAVIRRYLDAIDRKAQRYRSGWQGVAEFSGGYDSNANGGTADSVFLGFDLNEASVETESSFVGLEGQVAYSSPLTPVLGWRAALDARHREYPDASFVTQTSGRLRSGLAWAGSDWQIASDLSAEALMLDGEDNRQVIALDLYGHKQLSATTAGIANLRAAQVRYDEQLEVQDVDQWVGGLTLQWRPLAARRWQFQFGPLGGREDANDPASPFGRNLIGARAEVSAVSRGWIWRTSLGSLNSDYDGLFFGEERSDSQLTLQFQVEIPGVFRNWILRPSLTYVDNQSDIALYDYARVEAGLHLQRRW
ncbi:MAG: tetratricopeptide repeat protein [Panacagrimonas sp.]